MAVARLLVAPMVVLYRSRLVDFATVSQGLSLIPGLGGIALRRAWYEWTLAACGPRLVVEFLAAIRTPKSRLGADCYIGMGSWIGWVTIGDNYMSGNHVTILSGRNQHGSARIDVPMRHQAGTARMITIGPDVWAGSGAIIADDVARGTIIAAGSVVTRPFPEFAIIAGVPATVLRMRADTTSSARYVDRSSS
jgi:virginiamycin A acetyltransferase